MRFGEVVRKRLEELDWTYQDLAKLVKVSGVYISRIATGKTVPSDEVVAKLAQALDLNLERLVLLAHHDKAPAEVRPIFERLARRGAGAFLGDVDRFDNFSPHQLGHGRAIPVVGMVQAGAFAASEDGEYPAGVADEYVYSDTKAANLFGAKVEGDSMAPEFKEGDVLVVNPNLEAKNGDYVIAKLVGQNQATFKKLVLHPPVIILRPLNPAYHDIVLTDPAAVEVIGKVVERKTML